MNQETGTELVVGLGPIGANVGLRLVERGRDVLGFELDAARARAWAAEAGRPVASAAEEVPWERVTAVHVAVRLADQVAAVAAMLREHARPDLTVVVLTTLTPQDARGLAAHAAPGWRVFEAPLSGGPQGARKGLMTLIIAGPEPTAADEALFADLSARQFWMAEPGQPALVKLLNNTLGAYTALATAAMLRLAHREGLPASRLLEIVDVSSGGSWMSEHFPEFHHELLFKDVGLTRDAFGALPVIEFGDLAAHSATIEEVRGLLRADG